MVITLLEMKQEEIPLKIRTKLYLNSISLLTPQLWTSQHCQVTVQSQLTEPIHAQVLVTSRSSTISKVSTWLSTIVLRPAESTHRLLRSIQRIETKDQVKWRTSRT